MEKLIYKRKLGSEVVNKRKMHPPTSIRWVFLLILALLVVAAAVAYFPSRSYRPRRATTILQATTESTSKSTILQKEEEKAEAIRDGHWWDKKSWRAGFSSCKEEAAGVLGSVPLDISPGTYFRNGYGKVVIIIRCCCHSSTISQLDDFQSSTKVIPVVFKSMLNPFYSRPTGPAILLYCILRQ